MTPTEVLLKADLVFYGTVSDVVAENRAGVAWTLVTLRVDELLAGFGYDPATIDDARGGAGDAAGPLDPAEVAPESVTLAFLGGEGAGADLLVSGAPEWRFDESFLVAAYQQEGLASPLVGFRQGLWRIEDQGFVDLDGVALAIADDGSLVRAEVGATTTQVVRAVQGVLSGTVAPPEQLVEPDTSSDPDGVSAAPGAPEAEPAGPVGDATPTEPETQPPAEPDGAAPGDAQPPQPSEPGAAPDTEPAAEPATVRTIEIDYQVDDSGGPLSLSDKAAEAAAAWTLAVADGIELRLTETQDSSNRLRYGTDELLGPDTLSITTVAPGGVVTAYVSPSAGDLAQTAIVHEMGVIIGLPEGGAGVMASALTTERSTPSASDATELLARSRFEPADLTRDGTVDFYDLIAMAEAYGQTGVNLPGDLDGDGTVSASDIEVLRVDYQYTAPGQPPAPGQLPLSGPPPAPGVP
jgi:hypothetical protein